ncbi:hypothetical protein AB0M44_33690 [Streptosporangium subroseum]|uniref:winged helix-turn-helix transcriptional regulator n=1 Tax=Streptosporangium subroseum TaxID=106412 RepID=UPI00341970D1
MPTKTDGLSEPWCSIARSPQVLGERWTLLIVREAFAGRTRFADFRDSLQRRSRSSGRPVRVVFVDDTGAPVPREDIEFVYLNAVAPARSASGDGGPRLPRDRSAVSRTRTGETLAEGSVPAKTRLA